MTRLPLDKIVKVPALVDGLMLAPSNCQVKDIVRSKMMSQGRVACEPVMEVIAMFVFTNSGGAGGKRYD